MKVKRHSYVIEIQYLGFRYSGWQNQPGQKTIESMLVKTLKFVLPGQKLKILSAGRTDAKVSALATCFELFLEGHPIKDTDSFLKILNTNLPPDIRALSIKEANGQFNIIQDAKLKEYIYLFSFGAKNHPFCAPFLANILVPLNIEVMQEAAKLFIGTHDFSTYTASLRKNTKTLRTIVSSELKENHLLTANFFPKTSYAFHVEGSGFMRYQIRMMMGALIQLGKDELTISDIKNSLEKGNTTKLSFIAPASGLLLNHLEFNTL